MARYTIQRTALDFYSISRYFVSDGQLFLSFDNGPFVFPNIDGVIDFLKHNLSPDESWVEFDDLSSPSHPLLDLFRAFLSSFHTLHTHTFNHEIRIRTQDILPYLRILIQQTHKDFYISFHPTHSFDPVTVGDLLMKGLGPLYEIQDCIFYGHWATSSIGTLGVMCDYGDHGCITIISEHYLPLLHYLHH